MEFVRKLRILPSKKDAANLPEIANDPILKGSMDQMVVGKPMPVVPEMRAIWDSIRPHYEGVLAGIKTPENAAKDMQSDAIKKIKEMRGE
jgi:arabinogalactan oligomer/maltooligosaccharide transport system substrate-binding protein